MGPVDIDDSKSSATSWSSRALSLRARAARVHAHLRRDGRRPAGVRLAPAWRAGIRRAAAQAAVPTAISRLAAHRRARTRHRLHRQGRDRPEHPHVAGAGVADELRVPLDAVAGDGRHRPDAVRRARSDREPRRDGAAARAGGGGAREMLIDRAARSGRWIAPTLSARGRARSSGRTAIGFGELTKGQKLTGGRGRRRRRRRGGLRGTPRRRSTAARSSPAAHRFTPDITRPGCCTGASSVPTARARPWSMDDSARRGDAGVTVVRDGDFVGVVAPNERAATRAAAAIKASGRPAGAAVVRRRSSSI